jgi:flagellar basal-body rod protein FlgB
MADVEVLRPEQQIMQAALEVRSAKSELLAENVANADTPGFAARDIRFEDTLNNVLDGGNVDPQQLAESAVLVQNQRFDGNSVDVNQELGKVQENALKYVATLKLYGDSVNRLETALSST